MAIEKSEAIVLRLVDFSNTSCVVTVFTRDFGKISGIAKGARRLKSPFESALDVLAICHLVFIHKTSDALDILTEAKLQRRFRVAARDLGCLYAGYYLAELVLALTDDADPQPELYELLKSALIGLDSGESPEAWVVRFELRLLAILGQGVALDHCTVCGTPIEAARQSWLGVASGGLICAKCRPGKKQVIGLDAATLETLRVFSEPGPRWREDAGAASGLGAARGLLSQVITHILGYRPKLLPYLDFAKTETR